MLILINLNLMFLLISLQIVYKHRITLNIMMMNNNCLSSNEFKIYLESKQMNKKLISANDVADMLNVSKAKAYYHLYKMNKKGFIKRLKNGLYIFYPDNLLFKVQNYVEDPLYVLKRLVKPYFASHYTALNLHGLAQRSINTLYVTTTKNVKPLTQETYIIKPVIVSEKYFFGYEKMKFGSGLINVSNLERTIIDIVNRPDLAHGFEDIIKALLDIDVKLDYSKLFEYLLKFNKKILFQKIGYIFDSPIIKEYLKVPLGFLKRVKKKINSINYFNSDSKGGSYNKKWKVVVPMEIQSVFALY